MDGLTNVFHFQTALAEEALAVDTGSGSRLERVLCDGVGKRGGVQRNSMVPPQRPSLIACGGRIKSSS